MRVGQPNPRNWRNVPRKPRYIWLLATRQLARKRQRSLMSLLITSPATVAAAATHLAGIGSALSTANAAAAAPTTALSVAGADEVSVLIAALFEAYAQEYQALSAQALAFHDQFVQALNMGAVCYAAAETANATPLQALQTVQQNVLTVVNAPTQALLGRPIIGNGANGLPNTGQDGGPGGLPYSHPPSPPFCPVPATPLAPLPISGRPVSVCTGELMASRAVWPTICNGDELAASALAYWAAPALMSWTNCSWNATAWALSSWYACPCVANSAAIAADTSSAPAGSNAVIGTNASALARLIAEPIVARSFAAASTNAGATIICDVHTSWPLSSHGESIRPPKEFWNRRQRYSFADPLWGAFTRFTGNDVNPVSPQAGSIH